MWYKVISRTIDVLQRVFENRRQFIFTHFIYTSLGFVVFAPLLGFLGRSLLSLSGSPALTDQNILYYAMTPIGGVSFVFFGALFVFIIIFEQACLMPIADAAQNRRQITLLAALYHSFKRAPRIFSFAIRLVVRLALLILPFLAAAVFAASALITEYDINFYLTAKPPEFWWTVSLIGVLLGILLFILVQKSLDWSLSLPLILFTNTSPAQCFCNSARIIKTNRIQLLLSLIIWVLAVSIMSMLLFLAIHIIGTVLLHQLVNSLQVLVFVLGAVVVFNFIASLVITTIAASSLACILVEFFVRPDEKSSNKKSEHIYQRASAPKVAKRIKLRLAGFLIICTGVAGLVGLWLLNGIQIKDDVVIIAHRGAAGSAPENTLASVRRAIADGADWIEIDVQETADGEVIVIHDSDFMKLAGVNLSVRDGTLKQIRMIDVGSWYGPEFSDERVPTLAEVLEEVNGKSRLLIELKYYGYDQQLEQRVVDIVEQAKMVDNVMIMSLSYRGIQKVRRLRPGWKVGLLAAQAAGNLARLDVDFLAVSGSIVTTRLIGAATASGKQVFVWTINDGINMLRQVSLGVDGIITDEPGLAREVLERLSDMSPAERLFMHTTLLLGKSASQTQYRDDSP